MGRAARWLRSLLGRKKEKDDLDNSTSGKLKDRKRWSFGKVGKDSGRAPATDLSWAGSYETEEQSKHAIAVAAATAAAADAAVAAAHAAVAVVRLTSQGRSGLFGRGKEWCAAVRIQTVFRGYLARKALRALKGLVKLQALFRGYLVRKRATATLYSMQALMRAQVAVRSDRARRSLTRENRFRLETWARRSTVRSEFHSQRQLPLSLENGFDDSPKTVEMDTFKPRSRSEWSNEPPPPCHTFSSPLPSSIPVRLHRTGGSRLLHDPADWAFSVDECRASTTHSSPRFGNSGTPSAAPATPAKSVCGDRFFRPYCNFPGYMANTKSSKAKLRSQSAPKPRPEGAGRKAVSLEEILASRNSISGVRMQRCYSKDGSYF